MDTLERMKTLQYINAELDNDWAMDLRAEKQTDEMNLKLKSSGDVPNNNRRPEQIEENLSEQTTRDASLINNRKAMQLVDSNSNNSNVNAGKAEETMRMKLHEKCMNIFHFFGLLLGIRMTHQWQPQKHFLFYSTCFFLCFVGFSITYTIYLHLGNRNYIRILEPLAIFGLFLSCCLKLHGFLKHRHKMFSLMFTLGEYCKPKIFGRHADIIESNQRRTWTLLIIHGIFVVLAGSTFAITPIMVYITTKEVITLMPVEIVFCDLFQKSGFIAATIIHLIMGFYAVSATIMYGAAVIFCICNYIFKVDLIAEDFLQLDDMWNGKNNVRVAYKRAFLKNICKKRQDMNNYLNIAKDVFEAKLFKYFCGSYFSQIICLYDVTQNDWIGGYGPALALFMEMMFYCYMGTQVSIVDDKLCHTIYHCNWYTYDLESQWIVSMLLHESQKSKELKLGPLGPLNLVTGIAIVKGIYTYFTILIELL